jgi:hypothetical protein
MTLRAAVFSYLLAILSLAALPIRAQSFVAGRRTISSQNDRDSPQLTIRVHRIAPVSSWLLVSAEAEAARMLRSTHLRLTWINCPSPENSIACSIPERPTDLILHVWPTASPQATANALGMTMSSPVGSCAVLFYDRILTYYAHRTFPYQILGRAIAHEIVHLLLPTSSHTASGLMRAKWFTKDLQFGNQSCIGLPTRSVELIREEALRRMHAVKTPLER